MSRKILIDPNAAIREMAATEKATNKTFLLSKTCFLVFNLGCVKKYKINIYFHKMVQLFVNYRRANSAKWPIFRAKLFASSIFSFSHIKIIQVVHRKNPSDIHSVALSALKFYFAVFRLLKTVRISFLAWFYRLPQINVHFC